jgi:hypothetical protein
MGLQFSGVTICFANRPEGMPRPYAKQIEAAQNPAPKGRHIPAQGAALGYEPHKSRALKGRLIGATPILQAFRYCGHGNEAQASFYLERISEV